MVAAVNTVERGHERRTGIVGGLLILPFRVVVLLLGSLLLSIIFEWIGLAFFWREQGWLHAQSMFANELSWISDTFKQSLVIHEPGKTVEAVMSGIYNTLFVKTGFADFAREARYGAPGNGFWKLLFKIFVITEDYIRATLWIIMTFGVRIMILLLFTPLFLLTLLVGATDGLVRRDLRKFGAGRESSFIYHRAKKCILPFFVAPWLIYLTLPVSIPPLLIMIPCAVLLGLAVMITAATFKKYL